MKKKNLVLLRFSDLLHAIERRKGLSLNLLFYLTVSMFASAGHVRLFVSSSLRKRGITAASSRLIVSPSSSSSSSSLHSPLSIRSYTNTNASFHGKDPSNRVADFVIEKEEELPLGGKAFVECDRAAVIDLFQKHAVNCDVSGRYLDREGLTKVLRAVGENADPETVEKLFKFADIKQNGVIGIDVRAIYLLSQERPENNNLHFRVIFLFSKKQSLAYVYCRYSSLPLSSLLISSL